MAHEGLLGGFLGINDIDLCNRMVMAGVPYVGYRPVNGTGDNHAAPFGDERDIERGAEQWQNSRNKEAHYYLDRRVYIQLQGHNEQNYTNDGFWYLGVGRGGPAGRLKLFFGDGVGHPADQHISRQTGKAVSACWSLRVSSGCMREAKARGDLACVHQYGRLQPIYDSSGRLVEMRATSDPGSAIWPDGRRDDGAYPWFGGRHGMVWRDIIPPDSQMGIFVGEAGPSDATYRGPQQVISDTDGYDTRYDPDPFIVAYAYWSIGRGGGDPGDFAYSAFDDALPQIRDHRRAKMRRLGR